MKITPSTGTVIGKRYEQQLSGGFSIATEEEEKKVEFMIIVDVGPESEQKKYPLTMKPGDIAVFRKYSSNWSTLPDGQEYNFVDFKDIVAIVTL